MKQHQLAGSAIYVFTEYQFYILHQQRKHESRRLFVSFQRASQFDLYHWRLMTLVKSGYGRHFGLVANVPHLFLVS